MVIIVAVLEQAWQDQQFLCANHTQIPYFDREIKYLDFVSGHLSKVETEWPKNIRWPNGFRFVLLWLIFQDNHSVELLFGWTQKCVSYHKSQSFLADRFLHCSWYEYSMFFVPCLLPLPWVYMMVHALTEVRAHSPTLSYITSVIMMTIIHRMMTMFHGFTCHCVASMMGGE